MVNGGKQKQTLVVILLMLGSPVAAAEMPRQGARLEAAPPEGPVAEEAADDPARFDDWELACADGTCRIVTRVRAADGTEVLRIEAGGQPAVLRFATPLGLHLPDALVAQIGERTERRFPWRTCAPETGCLADAPLDSELTAALRRERAGTATFTLVEGVPVRLGFSLMGFTAAWRALGAVGGQ